MEYLLLIICFEILDVALALHTYVVYAVVQIACLLEIGGPERT